MVPGGAGPSWRAGDAARSGSRRLATSVGASAALHAAVIAAVFLAGRSATRPPAPPVYRVDLVAAPPGPRAIGTVSPEPAPLGTPAAPTPAPRPVRTPPAPAPTPAPAPPKAAAKAPPKPVPTPTPTPAKAKPVPAPARATPTPPAAAKPPVAAPKPATPATARPGEATGKAGAKGAPGPRAGGGPEGGKGADVANVKVNGLEFEYPGYLDNIVRQVALRFTPPNKSLALSADISFLIHRDGSVTDVRIVRRSGNYAFDLEAQGAIEAVDKARAFGPLPGPFRGDVLPVTFSFDPRVIR